MSKSAKPPASNPRDSSEEPAERTPINVTLPPIDATPEEIAQALFQRPLQAREVRQPRVRPRR